MKSDAIIQKAKKLWQAGQHAQAYAALNGFLIKNPKNAAVRQALVESLMAKFNDSAAMQVLAAGIQANPANKVFQERFTALIRSVKLTPPESSPYEERRIFIDTVGPAIGRALAENWGPANSLTKPACDLVMADPDRISLPELVEFASLPATEAVSFLNSTIVSGYTGNGLLDLVMRHALVVRPELEQALVQIRRAMLRVVVEGVVEKLDGGENWVHFLCNLALDAFQSEYALYQDDAEAEAVSGLLQRVQPDPATYVTQSNLALPILAAYIPLHRVFVDTEISNKVHASFVTLWREQVIEPRREAEIKDSIDVIGSPSGTVSLNVQQQYEENPYPRWRHPVVEPSPVSFRDFIHQQFPGLGDDALPGGGPYEALIAGCGTGSHPIHTASRFREMKITAMDLSLTSLAHAVRKTEELGISSIHYVQGDLLQCREIGKSYDLIESIGVLHHLEKPEEGLRELVKVLKPGGFMRLAFYSRTARSYIRAGQEFVARNGYGTGIDDIRQCRSELFSLQGKDPAAEIVKDYDFYSASGCRDLIMHVQEHQYDLSELQDMVAACDMSLLGFTNMPQRIRHAYQQRFPNDSQLSSWENLQDFEADNPESFSGMYGFWLHKPQ